MSISKKEFIESLDKSHLIPATKYPDKPTVHMFHIPGHGSITSEDLRTIADELDRRNQG